MASLIISIDLVSTLVQHLESAYGYGDNNVLYSSPLGTGNKKSFHQHRSGCYWSLQHLHTLHYNLRRVPGINM